MHTLWVANDNDFLQDLNGPDTNPNQFFVFGFKDADLAGSKYVRPARRNALLNNFPEQLRAGSSPRPALFLSPPHRSHRSS